MKKIFFSVVFLVLSVSVLRAQVGFSPLVIAHRGGAGDGLENTLSAIERSVATGVDAVEIDVRLTADGYIVVCHDATVNATTNGSGRVSELTLVQLDTLRIVDADGVPTNETIPTLKEVLNFVNGRCGVLVEVKEAGRGIEEKLIDDIVACDAAAWVSVQSFSDAVLFRLHELGAPFPLEKLVVFKIPLLPVIYDGTLRYFSFEKYQYVSSFNFHKRCLSRSFAAKIRAHGKDVKVWTLCSPADAPNVLVDAVITDFPSLWIEK